MKAIRTTGGLSVRVISVTARAPVMTQTLNTTACRCQPGRRTCARPAARTTVRARSRSLSTGFPLRAPMLQYNMLGRVTAGEAIDFLSNASNGCRSCALPVTLLMTRAQCMQMDVRTLGGNQFALAFQGRAFEPGVAHRGDVLVPPILLVAPEK